MNQERGWQEQEMKRPKANVAGVEWAGESGMTEAADDFWESLSLLCLDIYFESHDLFLDPFIS